MNPKTDIANITEEDHTVVIRHIKDPIHGFIKVTKLLNRFIDTKQFQRLRSIKQLGTTAYVWPGASHSRFEHSLGVAHLARKMVVHLQREQPDLGITNRDVSCIEIAGLCHDLGHGPWSHVWDSMFIPKALPQENWKHEQASEMMFDAMIEEYKIPLPKADQDFVKALIAGQPSRTPGEKPFLFEIVANSRNGLDVDKIDYIHRDSHMVGDPINLSPALIVKSAHVLNNEICYDIKIANQIYDLFQSRFNLHKNLYNHKTAKAIEHMIIDGLLLAEPHLKIAKRIKDPKKFLSLTDDIMPRIQFSEEDNLQPAREIFDRITNRDLYRCVDTKVIDWPVRKIFKENVTSARIVQAALALSLPNTPCPEQVESGSMSRSDSLETLMVEQLEEDDVIVDLATMHYGQKAKNPLEKVKFFSKFQHEDARPASHGAYSGVRPRYFAEVVLRIYTKNPAFFGLVQAGYRAVLAEMAEKYGTQRLYGEEPDMDEEDTPDIVTEAPTLPSSQATDAIQPEGESEPPTTPKAKTNMLSTSAGHSRNPSTATPDPNFLDNPFMTVSKDFGAPSSPSRSSKKGRTARRTESVESLVFGSTSRLEGTLERRRSVSQGHPVGDRDDTSDPSTGLPRAPDEVRPPLKPAHASSGESGSTESEDPFMDSLASGTGEGRTSGSPTGKRRRAIDDDVDAETGPPDKVAPKRRK